MVKMPASVHWSVIHSVHGICIVRVAASVRRADIHRVDGICMVKMAEVSAEQSYTVYVGYG